MTKIKFTFEKTHALTDLVNALGAMLLILAGYWLGAEMYHAILFIVFVIISGGILSRMDVFKFQEDGAK